MTFASAEAATAAHLAMHRSTFQGRILHAMPAISRRAKPDPNDKRSLKDQNMQKMKTNANREFNWSMLYMNVSNILRAPFRSY